MRYFNILPSKKPATKKRYEQHKNDLVDLYQMLHPVTTEYMFFSRIEKALIKIDQT